MSGWLTVHVRINDADTGKPVPVRVRFEARGEFRAPLGRVTDFTVAPGFEAGGHLECGPERFHTIDGACEIRLPPGPVRVHAERGPEYLPLDETVTLSPGQVSLRLSLRRWIDLRRDGWYAGDTQVFDTSPHAALLEAAAEDVAVVNLLAREVPGAVAGILAFSGMKPALEREGHLVAVNTLNTHPTLGTLSLLNCHRPIYPLRFGGDGPDDWTLADWCDQCHRKKAGLVVWTDTQVQTGATPAPGQRLRGEVLANAILGRVDAYEVVAFDAPEPAVLADWYTLLSAGYRLPLVGGSGKDSAGLAVGRTRTYARLAGGKACDYAGWVEAVRAGHTFITNGPILMLSAAGLPPGTTVELPSPVSVPLRAEFRGNVPVTRLELLVNGEVVAAKEASGSRLSAVVETEWPVEATSWVAARCWCEEQLPDGQPIFAHTSPVWLNVAGRPFPADAAVLKSLLDSLGQRLEWVRREARCETDAQRDRLAAVFLDAAAALRQRMG